MAKIHPLLAIISLLFSNIVSQTVKQVEGLTSIYTWSLSRTTDPARISKCRIRWEGRCKHGISVDAVVFDGIGGKSTESMASSTAVLDNLLNMMEEMEMEISFDEITPTVLDNLLNMMDEMETEMSFDEITPEFYEKIEIALGNLDTEDQYTKEESKPTPPSILPPFSLLEGSDAHDEDDLRSFVTPAMVANRNIAVKNQQTVMNNDEASLGNNNNNSHITNQNNGTDQNQTSLPAKFTATRKRPTTEIPRRGQIIGNNYDNTDDGTNRQNNLQQQDRNSNPDGIPVLFNWKQHDDGSIVGKVKQSPYFNDGATVHTSAVLPGACGGDYIITASKSMYLLEKISQEEERIRAPEKIEKSKLSNSVRRKAAQRSEKNPDGVPSISSWVYREDGVISGLNENRGYVETTPIINGCIIESGSVVFTQSGSRYFLMSSDNTIHDNDADNFLSSISTSRVDRGTITISEGSGKNRKATTKRDNNNKLSAIDTIEQVFSRSTFSLLDFVKRETKSFPLRATNNSEQSTPPPSPILNQWSINNDGTITGFIFGSRNIDDGYLITTSPIVQGRRQQFETVTTATGSLYFLG